MVKGEPSRRTKPVIATCRRDPSSRGISASMVSFSVTTMYSPDGHPEITLSYPARITSITGSSTNPIYIVSFKSYSTTETLTAKDIKPISNNDTRKRKADGISGTPGPQSLPANSSVISAAADINPALASKARTEGVKPADGSRPAKVPRKVKGKRDLEAGKAKWQDFASKGKFGKATKKESMFRTPEGINARVGFTGSGQQMRKDPTRSRHVYQQEEDTY
ncbi:hypothetical protein CISG_09188 [Coccidioides immitis RMSCC 3703]|uniref:Uncharacterized protein n=1 Tax=Coccidioides immitis RMSCC 3703 TaxID=454286 RepID=A0A0J8R903_COCIT|nr:hypothetical protein CISG_09188 [Coccidioides immitis RMSCC 3703]